MVRQNEKCGGIDAVFGTRDNMPPSNSQLYGWGGSEDMFHGSMECVLSESLFSALEDGKKIAQEIHKPALIRLPDGEEWLIHPRGTKHGLVFSWIISRGGMTLLIAKLGNPREGSPNVMFEVGSLACMQFGAEYWWGVIKNVVASFGGHVRRSYLGRVDVAADLASESPAVDEFATRYLAGRYVARGRYAGIYREESSEATASIEVAPDGSFDGDASDGDALVSCFETGKGNRKSNASEKEQLSSLRFWGRAVTGIEIGNGIRFRAYDKERESRKGDQAKREFLIKNRWGGRACAKATRVEFQIRRQALKDRGIDSCEDYFRLRSELIRYLTHQYIRFIEEKVTNGHHSRSKPCTLWKCFQWIFENAFGAAKCSIQRVRKSCGNRESLRQQLLGVLSSLLVSEGREIRSEDLDAWAVDSVFLSIQQDLSRFKESFLCKWAVKQTLGVDPGGFVPWSIGVASI